MNIENCLICSGKTNHEILIKHREFYITKCLGCGLIQQSLYGNYERLQQVYENIRRDRPIYNSNSIVMLKKFDIIFKDIQKYHEKPGEMLDIGCGFGTYMELFASRGWKVTGIDLSENCINWARSKNLNCYLTSVEKFVSNRKFDLILMNHTIEHFQDPLAILNKAKSWLAERGILYIRVPNVDSKAVRFLKANFVGHLKPFEHLYYFNAKTLKSLITKGGFDAQIHLDLRNFLRDIITYLIRSRLILKSSWIKINYDTAGPKKKKYLFFRDFYEKLLPILDYIPIGAKDKEVVAVVKKKR